MSKDDLEPKKLILLTENKQIKAYVHPTRIVLLKMLAKEKRTISNIARELKVHPANITHHFKLLERVGLIRLVEKRDIGKNIEKYYRAMAYNFVIQLEESKESNKKALGLAILKNDLAVAINTVKKDDGKEVMALLGTARLNAHDVAKFLKKLKALVEGFKRCDSMTGIAYNINLSLYPNDVNCISQEKIIID